MNGKRAVTIVELLALAGYGAFLILHLSFAAGGPDTSGYMNEARMIATEHLTRPVELIRTLRLDDSWLRIFMPLGFAPSPHGTMHPTYPPGLPVHIALAGIIGGWARAPFIVVPLAAVASLAMMFALARRLDLSLPLACAAPIVLAFLPPLLWHAVQPASDVLAMFWALTAIYLSIGRQSTARIVAAGAAFAIGVCVRPTNLLLIVALVLAMKCRARLLLKAAAGAIPFASLLMLWNRAEYGSAFRTGYGNVMSILSWGGVVNAGPEYVRNLVAMLTVIVFPAGLLVVFDKLANVWTRWMLFTWFVPFFVFYCFYGFWDDWRCLRFLLPAIPALIFASLILIRDLHAKLASWNAEVAHVAAAAVLIYICSAPFFSSGSLELIPTLCEAEAQYPRYVRWAEGHLPRRSLVVTGVLSGAFLYYENRGIARYDQLDDQHFQTLRAYAGNAGLPWYAVLSDVEIDHKGLENRLKGKWTLIDQRNDISIYRLDS